MRGVRTWNIYNSPEAFYNLNPGGIMPNRKIIALGVQFDQEAINLTKNDSLVAKLNPNSNDTPLKLLTDILDTGLKLVGLTGELVENLQASEK